MCGRVGRRDTARDDSTDPLPIPSISWWWRHDPGDQAPTPTAPERLLVPFGTTAGRIGATVATGPSPADRIPPAT